MSGYIMRSTDDSSIEVVRPDNSSFRLIEVTGELSALLARAEKAEAERDELRRKLYPGKDEELFGVVKSRVIDWQRVKIDAAIAAMQGILAGNLYRELLSGDGWPEQRAAFLAVDHASMLTEELKKEKAE